MQNDYSPGRNDQLPDEEVGSKVNKQRKRAGGRRLMRWNPSEDQYLLLCVEYVCNRENICFPWKLVASQMNEFLTEEGIKQHLAKVRASREAEGQRVPPKIKRTSKKLESGKYEEDVMKAKGKLPTKGAGLLHFPQNNARKRDDEAKSELSKTDSNRLNGRVRGPNRLSKLDESNLMDLDTDTESADNRNNRGHKRKRGRAAGLQKEIKELGEDLNFVAKKQRTTKELRALAPVNYSEAPIEDEETFEEAGPLLYATSSGMQQQSRDIESAGVMKVETSYNPISADASRARLGFTHDENRFGNYEFMQQSYDTQLVPTSGAMEISSMQFSLPELNKSNVQQQGFKPSLDVVNRSNNGMRSTDTISTTQLRARPSYVNALTPAVEILPSVQHHRSTASDYDDSQLAHTHSSETSQHEYNDWFNFNSNMRIRDPSNESFNTGHVLSAQPQVLESGGIDHQKHPATHYGSGNEFAYLKPDAPDWTRRVAAAPANAITPFDLHGDFYPHTSTYSHDFPPQMRFTAGEKTFDALTESSDGDIGTMSRHAMLKDQYKQRTSAGSSLGDSIGTMSAQSTNSGLQDSLTSDDIVVTSPNYRFNARDTGDFGIQGDDGTFNVSTGGTSGIEAIEGMNSLEQDFFAELLNM